jgi:hypothetical protein
MPVGLNGQQVLPGWDDPRLVQVPVAGTRVRLTVRRGWYQRVAAYVAWRWHNEVEPLVRGECWGYDYRPARAAGGAWSSHATGYCIDLNSDHAGAQLWGSRKLKATGDQLAAMRRIKQDTGLLWGGPRWAGGDYGPSDYAGGAWVDEPKAHFVDPMHWDLPSGIGDAEAWCKALCLRLGIGPDGTTGSAPVPPVVKPPVTEHGLVISVKQVQPGDSNDKVRVVQATLNKVLPAKLVVDGQFGRRTQAAYAAWQRSLGYRGVDADGVPGFKSLTSLGRVGKFLVIP